MIGRRSMDELFDALARSAFRKRQRLNARDAAYLRERGTDAVLAHAHEFIRERLAPARPANDGKQTPWRGHPAFVAQHATGTCCRRCLEKWHGIGRGHALSEKEQAYVVNVIGEWLKRSRGDGSTPGTLTLFD